MEGVLDQVYARLIKFHVSLSTVAAAGGGARAGSPTPVNIVADPGSPEARAPLPLFKLVKKGWPPRRAASFASHRTPLGQISGSATVKLVKTKRWPPRHTAIFTSHRAPLQQISGSATAAMRNLCYLQTFACPINFSFFLFFFATDFNRFIFHFEKGNFTGW